MGYSLAMMLETIVGYPRQSIDPVLERMFHLMSGRALVAVDLRVRRSFEDREHFIAWRSKPSQSPGP